MAAMKTLADIDRNLAVCTSFGRDDVVLFDPRTPPFSLYGVYFEDGAYRRMPDAVAATVSEGVRGLAPNTAGGRVCFSTDSDFVAISCQLSEPRHMAHMPLAGSSGFDLYTRAQGRTAYCATFMPNVQKPEAYESIFYFPSHEQREVLIHFPLYSDVASLQIGLQKGASLRAWNGYRISTPVVFYGSSITQGACASTPGNDYIGRLSRRFDFDYINLGFSGNAKAEPAIMKYIAGLSMSAFVYDYDNNAPTNEHLAATHYIGYRTVREAHPDIPIVMASRPSYDNPFQGGIPRREIIAQSYARALAEGDKNVYFVDGAEVFRTFVSDGCTVDGCHPTDLGFYRMAEAFAPVFSRFF